MLLEFIKQYFNKSKLSGHDKVCESDSPQAEVARITKMIGQPDLVSAQLVRKIVTAGILRLEREGVLDDLTRSEKN
ncbi:hypothetical protein V9J34_001350 [Salmonella enterica]|uniref:Uncharacterized protein n=1 Tax=Salmonella enterica subsp. enterica serovar Abeokuta TaxID=2926665 RepID=A0A8T9IEE4_SALET|nr:hypothetical protein [Salmonella enterica]SQJ25061.1 Uncharacterised protein [Salmonella enterica subsp. enterica] [Salmonella enterica subsp. enterica serovar Menston]ECE1929294.1 hypothetical protein [Salmonella enterica]EDW9823536.1 hypothetical protein [Salmonella enterica]EKC9955226.1 hypothetical protein [Salmonella enterica]UNO32317.1 hypothetical protein MOV10_14335 [Salmonella enterica subsp. enterica serovar Abeokuta]